VRRPSKRSQHDTQGLWRVGGHRNRPDPSYRNSKRRQQRGEPAGVQGALGFVESRPGDPVAFGDFADTDSVDPVTPHHLVPSLEQIVRIEERIAARHASSLPAYLVCRSCYRGMLRNRPAPPMQLGQSRPYAEQSAVGGAFLAQRQPV